MSQTSVLALRTTAETPYRESEPETAVEVCGLTKRFPVRRSWAEMLRHPRRREYVLAVDDVTFEVSSGEFFGLLGPNGAGKSTLFKILSTLIEPDAGEIRVAGYDLRTSPQGVRSALSPVIADERSLNWRLSATENLRFYASLYGLRGDERNTRVGELLELVDLRMAGHKIVGAFSSGMKQRLLLARALLARPRVLLLDEPTRSLDPVAARGFRSFLKEDIAGKQGCSVLLATHNSEEALQLCDRVAVLDRGRMIAIGTPDKLIRRVAGLRYRVWTALPTHPVFSHLEEMPWLKSLERTLDAKGCPVVELVLSNDEDRPAAVLETLVQAGVPVTRYELVQLPLAELIDVLVRSDGTYSHTA